jgi:hypothetical protein
MIISCGDSLEIMPSEQPVAGKNNLEQESALKLTGLRPSCACRDADDPAWGPGLAGWSTTIAVIDNCKDQVCAYCTVQSRAIRADRDGNIEPYGPVFEQTASCEITAVNPNPFP